MKRIPQVFVDENISLTQVPATLQKEDKNKSLTQVPATLQKEDKNKSLTRVPVTLQKEVKNKSLLQVPATLQNEDKNKSSIQVPATLQRKKKKKSSTQVPATPQKKNKNKSSTQVPATPQKKDFWDSSVKVIQPFYSQQTCSECKTSQLKAMLPEVDPNISDLFGANVTCAVVTGSPTLQGYYYGQFIDSFPVVMRFNLHGTNPPSSYGSKTTHRLINQKVNRKNITFVSNLSEIVISKYLKKPEEMLSFYLARKQNFNRSYILRTTFQNTVSVAIGTYPRHATAGLLGLFLLSKTCTSIHTFGFINKRDEYTNRSHDYDAEHKVLQKWSQDPNAQVQLVLHP